jgi:translation initiation factor IF-2
MINKSMGIKICAPSLDEAIAGTELQVVGPDDDVEDMKNNVDGEFDSILNGFEKQPEGVHVKASTLGSLEALLSFLLEKEIPIFDVGIGEVSKKDVSKAMIMKEKKHPEYAVILCFDVKVSSEAKRQAAADGVGIFTADIIYHLFDRFTAYMDTIRESKKAEARAEAVFPVVLEIDRNHVFRKTTPIIFACNVVEGQLRLGTPICIPDKGNLDIGRVSGIEKDRDVPLQIARKGDQVCVKIEQSTAQHRIAYGRNFDATNRLCSAISRSSIDVLQNLFDDEMKKEDWKLIVGLKKVFKIR